ncbi:MAG: hypothetical protein WDN44_01265 [Sphingomonas sp.]
MRLCLLARRAGISHSNTASIAQGSATSRPFCVPVTPNVFTTLGDQ